jgi:hypothetical protein
MVDVHAGELLADGLDEKSRHNGAVHTAGEGEEHLLVANLSSDLSYLLVNESGSELGGSDSLHCFGTYVIHICLLLSEKLRFLIGNIVSQFFLNYKSLFKEKKQKVRGR